MQLFFHLQAEAVRIVLQDADVERGVAELNDVRSLSQTLLPAVDALLRQNTLEVHDVESIGMQSAMSPVFTSYRIVEATVKSLNVKI